MGMAPGSDPSTLVSVHAPSTYVLVLCGQVECVFALLCETLVINPLSCAINNVFSESAGNVDPKGIHSTIVCIPDTSQQSPAGSLELAKAFLKGTEHF